MIIHDSSSDISELEEVPVYSTNKRHSNAIVESDDENTNSVQEQREQKRQRLDALRKKRNPRQVDSEEGGSESDDDLASKGSYAAYSDDSFIDDDDDDDDVPDDGTGDEVAIAVSVNRGHFGPLNVADELMAIRTQPREVSFNLTVQYLTLIAMDGYTKAHTKFMANHAMQKAVRTIQDQLNSLKYSFLTSNAWSAEFKSELESLPEYEVHDIDHGGICDVCNRKGRVATMCITLSGKPYSRTTFEPGRNSKHTSVTYNTGRFCETRVQLYHRLHHYFKYLYNMIKGAADVSTPDPPTLSTNPDSVQVLFTEYETMIEDVQMDFSSG